jgi:hypothetical protein
MSDLVTNSGELEYFRSAYGKAYQDLKGLRAQLVEANACIDEVGCAANNAGYDSIASLIVYMSEQHGIKPVVPEGWRLLPEDLATHLGDWRMACKIASQQPDQQDGGAACYWDHQLKTLNNIEAELSAAKEDE